MCYKVDCNKCGKYGWGGCGKHLTTLYHSIEEGMHCMCRPWPGLALPSSTPLNPKGNRNPRILGIGCCSVIAVVLLLWIM